MNVTLSIDDAVLARARELAKRRGTSVDQMIQEYLANLVSDLSSDEILRRLDDLWAASAGDSRGRRWTREELHDRSGLR